MSDYVREVEEFFLTLVGQGAALPEGDVALILKWQAEGIPVDVVKRALEGDAKRMLNSGTVELPARLRFYRAAVEKAAKQWQASSEAGFVENQTTPEPSLKDEVKTRLAQLPEKYRESVMQAMEGVAIHDPEQLNAALIRGLLDAMDEKNRATMEKAAADAEKRGLASGLGRMAARNLGQQVLKKLLMEEIGIDTFV